MTPDDDPLARTAVAVLGVNELVLGLWMAVFPGSFSATLAAFGPHNPHLVRDMSTSELAIGALALLAVRRPAWRLPVVAVAALHFALHTVNHLVDLGEADPAWIGPFDAVTLALGTGALAWLGLRLQRSSA